MQKMLFGFVVLVFLFSACQEETYPLVPEKVRQVIFFSDVNYIEFVEAINQFRKPEDKSETSGIIFPYREYAKQWLPYLLAAGCFWKVCRL